MEALLLPRPEVRGSLAPAGPPAPGGIPCPWLLTPSGRLRGSRERRETPPGTLGFPPPCPLSYHAPDLPSTPRLNAQHSFDISMSFSISGLRCIQRVAGSLHHLEATQSLARLSEAFSSLSMDMTRAPQARTQSFSRSFASGAAESSAGKPPTSAPASSVPKTDLVEQDACHQIRQFDSLPHTPRLPISAIEMQGAKVYQCPTKYIQHPGLISHAGQLVKDSHPNLVKAGILLSSRAAKGPAGKKLIESFTNAEVFEFNTECTRAGVAKVVERFQSVHVDHVVCFGGGKIIDVGKMVGAEMDVCSVVMPSIASSDAPCTALGVLYTETGEFDEYKFLPQSPSMVLVDTEVIMEAPARFLIAGMGDALSTYYEARACDRVPTACNLIFPFTYRPPGIALAISRQCRDNLFEYGAAALKSLGTKTSSKAFESVVEANILMSGIGVESGGLAAAHAIHNGIAELPESHVALHGEKVAFGTICHLYMEGEEEEAKKVIAFCKEVGLPTCFKDLGVDITDEKLKIIADHCLGEGTSAWNMGPELNFNWLVDSMKKGDKAGSAVPEAVPA